MGQPMKTIGVLGGLGPQATMAFEAHIHRLSQQLIPHLANSGYPPMVVYYYRHAPVLLFDDGSPVLPIQPDPCLLEAAKRLGKWADFLVITANSPHLLQNSIEQHSSRKVVSMIEATLAEVRHRKAKRVGVLGLGEPRVYLIPLEQQGIAYQCISEERRSSLDQAIFRFAAGEAGPEDYAIAQQAIEDLRSREVDAIVLGCTEIPFLLQEQVNASDLIDPLPLLAEASITYALS